MDSLPLASELRGEPGRLRFVEEVECLRDVRWWEGVSFFSFSGLDLLSSGFLCSSSFCRSLSVESDSLWERCQYLCLLDYNDTYF